MRIKIRKNYLFNRLTLKENLNASDSEILEHKKYVLSKYNVSMYSSIALLKGYAKMLDAKSLSPKGKVSLWELEGWWFSNSDIDDFLSEMFYDSLTYTIVDFAFNRSDKTLIVLLMENGRHSTNITEKLITELLTNLKEKEN